MDFEKLSCELLRELRGHRSQMAFSKSLGFRSNVAYPWESGRRFPTASQFLGFSESLGDKTTAQALSEFFGYVAPDWIKSATSTPGNKTVARLLREVHGDQTIASLAKESGLSRFAVGRALSGESDPRLPDFLKLIAASSRRLMDFVSVFVDPARLPEASAQWRQVSSLRALAYDYPASEAVLCALELEGYGGLTRHDDTWVAQSLGLDLETVQASLAALSRAGVVRWNGRRWCVEEDRFVDTRSDVDGVMRLKRHWAQTAADSVGQRDGLFSYVVFSVSADSLQELRELHLSYYWRLRDIVARSKEATEVVVANVHLFPLG